MKRPPFIVFEGGEGSGKTSQSARLGNYLADAGYDVMNTRAPGGVKSAEDIRTLLLTGDADRWSKESEILLFTAARVEHARHAIIPALDAGTTVICDRFLDSTLAYQGNGDHEREKQIYDLHRSFVGDLRPDLTVYLDIDPVSGLTRSQKRLNAEASNESRFENMELNFHRRQRAVFQRLAAQAPRRYLVLDATESMDKIHRDIIVRVMNDFDVKMRMKNMTAPLDIPA